MVVYEATTKEHYLKIMKFIKSQPEDSLPKKCYQAPGLKFKSIEELKEKYANLRVFVVEDEQGNIRYVPMWVQRSDYDYQGKNVTVVKMVGALMHYKDVEEKNYDYRIEFFLNRLNQGEFKKISPKLKFVIAVIPLEDVSSFKWLFGDAVEISLPIDSLQGKFCQMRIDVEKMAG